MNEQDAELVISKDSEIDTLLSEIVSVAENMRDPSDAHAFRKSVAEVVGCIYEQIEMPIYRQYPNMSGRLDE